MTRLQKVFAGLEEVIGLIDEANGYNTTAGEINQMDDVLGYSHGDPGTVLYYYRIAPAGIADTRSHEVNTYSFNLPVVITAKCVLDGDEDNPRVALKKRQWEIFDDVRRAFGDALLNRTTTFTNEAEHWAFTQITDSVSESEDLLNAGEVIFRMNIYVTQSMANITKKGC